MGFLTNLDNGISAFKSAFASGVTYARLSEGTHSYNYETERMGMFSALGFGQTYFSPKENAKNYYKDTLFLAGCINLYADFASQVRISEVNEHGDEVLNSAYVEFLERPNIWQNKTDYIKELVVNLLTTGISIQAGNFFENGDLRPRSTLFNLEFNNLKFPEIKDPYVLFSDEVKNLEIIETLENGLSKKRKVSEIAFFYDTISDKAKDGVYQNRNLYFNPISRIFPILKSLHTLMNSDDTLCFLSSNPVSAILSKDDPSGTRVPLDQHQKLDIERKVNGRGKYGAGTRKAGDIIATNESLKKLDLTRDNKKLMITEIQQNAKENVREMFLIPKDFFGGSTYENQQFAEAKFILGNVKTITDNWLQELVNKTPLYFKNRKTKLVGTYDHLPSVIAIKGKLKNEGFKAKAEAMTSLLTAFEKAKSLEIESDFVTFANQYGFSDFINAGK